VLYVGRKRVAFYIFETFLEMPVLRGHIQTFATEMEQESLFAK
jgi:hypothetical protein